MIIFHYLLFLVKNTPSPDNNVPSPKNKSLGAAPVSGSSCGGCSSSISVSTGLSVDSSVSVASSVSTSSSVGSSDSFSFSVLGSPSAFPSSSISTPTTFTVALFCLNGALLPDAFAVLVNVPNAVVVTERVNVRDSSTDKLIVSSSPVLSSTTFIPVRFLSPVFVTVILNLAARPKFTSSFTATVFISSS